MAVRALIYRAGGLGDTLLVLVALDALRARFPDVRITLAARPAYAAPLLDAGRADEIIDAEGRPFHLLYTLPSGDDELCCLLRAFDVIVLFTKDPEGTAATRLAFLKGKNALVISPFPPENTPCHISQWMARALARLGAPEVPAPPEALLPSPESSVRAKRALAQAGIPEGFLAVHPGSGGATKWAPTETLVGIARRFCQETASALLLLRGPADDQPCVAFEEVWGGKPAVLEVGEAPLLGAALRRSLAYMGCDSGVSHLAALYGVPTLALFGPASNPALWAPIGRRALWCPWQDEEAAIQQLLELARQQKT